MNPFLCVSHSQALRTNPVATFNKRPTTACTRKCGDKSRLERFTVHRFTETANRSIPLFLRNSGRKTAHVFPGIALSLNSPRDSSGRTSAFNFLGARNGTSTRCSIEEKLLSISIIMGLLCEPAHIWLSKVNYCRLWWIWRNAGGLHANAVAVPSAASPWGDAITGYMGHQQYPRDCRKTLQTPFDLMPSG